MSPVLDTFSTPVSGANVDLPLSHWHDKGKRDSKFKGQRHPAIFDLFQIHSTDGANLNPPRATPWFVTTRSQADARIADRTASQHLWSYVTSSVT